MEFKHITVEKGLNRDFYFIKNKHSNELIARIEYYSKWGKWMLMPEDGTIYDETCLEDITKAIRGIKNAM